MPWNHRQSIRSIDLKHNCVSRGRSVSFWSLFSELGRMGNASLLLLFLALGFASAMGGSTEAIDSSIFPHSGSSGVVWPQAEPACNRLIGECYPEEEMLLDSESNSRILYPKTDPTHISYQALNKDSVPCNQKGAPYYNCRAGGKANPYSRGCFKITHCQRDTS